MRIGLCGAGGTGKSTLAKALAERYNIPMIPSVVRAVMAERNVKAETDQNAWTPVQRWELQREIFKRRTLLERNQLGKPGIFDRTLVDHLAYCFYRCASEINDISAKAMVRSALASLGTYDLVIYCPFYQWEIPSDGLRQGGYAYDLMINAFIFDVIQPAEFVTMPNISVAGRVQLVESYI